MNYKDHPLLEVSRINHNFNQPKEDQSNVVGNRPSVKTLFERIKRKIGFYLYPLKNKIQKKIIFNKIQSLSKKMPDQIADTISLGHKGYSQEIFLSQIRKKTKKNIEKVIVFGCGTGEEVYNVAKYLSPKKIIAIDYFNYKNIWNQISKKANYKYNVEVEFRQLDYSKLDNDLIGSSDIIYSHTVLEHFRDMDFIFSSLTKYLKEGGYFAAQWGPMWYSYSGDHISGELGVEKGFEHLILNADDYLKFYKNHPRNKPIVETGNLTWLELGLHNFATYDEYILSLEKHFGEIYYLHWVISKEAIHYKKYYPNNFNKILKMNSHISEFDLITPCAGILLKKNYC